MDVCPLVFEPIFVPKLWGGRQLAELFDKPLPPDEPIGESWEVADLEAGQSVVARGPAAGQTLGELTHDWGEQLLGSVPPFEGRFPLLIKYLDAQQTLSVQVHPDEAYAQQHGGDVRVKNEAWYVLAAEPDGHIYRGFHPGVDEAALRAALAKGEVEPLLQRIPVRAGHCYYLPSGTIHALGAGVVVAEVQTPSNTTFRFFDWNRVDPSTGKARALHIDEALACVRYDAAPPAGEQQAHLATPWSAVTRLVRCPSFVLERVRITAGIDQELPYQAMVVWMVLEGKGEISYNGMNEPFPFGRGDCVVLPAGLQQARLRTHEDCLWLEASVPVPSDLAGYPRPEAAELRGAGFGTGLVHVNVPGRPA